MHHLLLCFKFCQIFGLFPEIHLAAWMLACASCPVKSDKRSVLSRFPLLGRVNKDHEIRAQEMFYSGIFYRYININSPKGLIVRH